TIKREIRNLSRSQKHPFKSRMRKRSEAAGPSQSPRPRPAAGAVRCGRERRPQCTCSRRAERSGAMGSGAVGSPRATAPGQQLRALFYVLPPGESTFRTVEEVPDYVEKSIPFFIAFIGLEFAVSWIQRRKLSGRVNDGISCLSLGILSRLPDVLFRSIDLISYIYVWNNYRLFELPWDSPWTWYLTFLGVDFAYYCFHRMGHEVNILWAAHQVHHSSEDYNLFTALRQSVLQKYTSWIFNLPMALFIPPSVFAVHLQFNLLYQFWIHTEVNQFFKPYLNKKENKYINKHQGDKNTFFNSDSAFVGPDRIYIQYRHKNSNMIPRNKEISLLQSILRPLAHIWNTFWATPGFCNKLSVIFKGPGWGPGKPRLGLPEDIPVVTGKEVPFNPSIPAYLNCYAVVHFAVIMDLYTELLGTVTMLSPGTVLLRIGFIILSLTSFGLLLENRQDTEHAFSGILEIIRCLVFVGVYKLGYLRSQFSFLGYAYEV
ncbi:ALKMO monooxygenase, partial [Fregetta grallaria]|nr:ALKMO monooxygenase [Fregetta grallaria]